MGLNPKIRRYCKDCAYFKGELSAQDRMLLERMLERYGAEVMLKSWVELGQVKKPGGHSGLDQDKVRSVEILKRRALCKREHVSTSPVDLPCFAFKPRAEAKP